MLWYLDLQQLVQSMPITTKVVSSYHVQLGLLATTLFDTP